MASRFADALARVTAGKTPAKAEEKPVDEKPADDATCATEGDEETDDEEDEDVDAVTNLSDGLDQDPDDPAQAKGKAKCDAEPMAIRGEVKVDIQAAGEDGKPGPATFEMIAYTGQPMRLEGWKYPVVVELAGLHIPSQNIPIRMNHDKNQGVGHTNSVGIEGGNLVARGVVSRKTVHAEDVKESARQGFPWQASIGSSADDVEFIKSGETVTVNGKQCSGPLNVVRRGSLGEISFVDRGADGDTSVRVAAMAKDGQTGAADDLNDKATGNIGDLQADLDRRMSSIQANRKRVECLSALGIEYSERPGADVAAIGKLIKKAIEAGWDPKDTELEILRATRVGAPAIHRVDAPKPKVLEAALCMAAGVKDEFLAKDRDYGPDVVQQAYPIRNYGIRDTIAAAAASVGIDLPRGNTAFYDALVQNSSRLAVQAEGFSTVNLPGILGNVANKVLLQAFLNIKTIYDTVAEQADFNNFYTHSIYRLETTGDFAKVGGDGELKNATLAQDAYTNKVDTYGQILTLSRVDIINDDLGAFSRLTAQLARRARIAVDKALVTIMMESSDSFYTSDHGNRNTTNALSVAGLGVAKAAMIKMADQGGDPIYAEPKFLVVPPELEYLANQFHTSKTVFNAGASAPLPTDNPYAGMFQPITSPFFSNAALTGYSATTWYLVADPASVPAFQVAYLQGRRAPTVETAQAAFNIMGMQMRVYWDFGVAQVDYRGANKNTP